MEKIMRLACCLRILSGGLAFAALNGTAAESKIVALGASQTHGKGVLMEDAYPAQLQQLLRAEGHDVSIVNAGVDGDTSADIAKRLDAAVPEGTTLVILQPGTNDRNARGRRGTLSEDETRENIDAMLAKLRVRNIKVILLGYPGGGGGPVAKKHSATWFGQIRIPGQYRQPDGQHYSREGYAVLAAELAPLVKAQLAPARR
jgi:acyl-CoA thioesterase-1